MEQQQPLSDTAITFRRALHIVIIPLCLFTAGYCFVASRASGGWRTNREGEPSYTAPVHHTKDFYQGLRWSVLLVGGMMALASYCCDCPGTSAVFGAIAALYNPFVPIQMSKETWEFIDILVFWVFLGGSGALWPRKSEKPPQTSAPPQT